MGRRRPKKRPPTPSESEDEAGVEEEEAPMLPVGAEVEVRSDDPGFAGSFYEATVAGHLVSSGGGRRYTLAYSALLAEEGGPLKDKETAAAADVRPRPPPEENAGAAPARRVFAICEMVEAFHNQGWWAGVVSAVPPPVTGDLRRGVYKVTFPTSRETMEFEETALRPHRVFQDGRWVPAAEVDNGSTLFSEGNQVEVSQSAKNFDESWSPATVLKVIGAKHFLVQYVHIEKNEELATEIVDSQYIRPARIIACMDSRYRFPPSSPIEVFHQGSWCPGVIVEVLPSGIHKKYLVKLNHETDMEDLDCVGVMTVENAQLRPQLDWDGKKWVHCMKKQKEVIAAKTTAEDHNILAIFEDLAQLPNDMIAGCEILSEMNTVSCIDLTPCKDIRGSQERSGVHDLQQGGYAGETSVEQDTGEELCQRYLVMADDANDRLCINNTTSMVECMTGCVAPAEDLTIISPAALDGVVLNLLQSDVKFEVDITDDMDEENHRGSVLGSPTNGNQTQYASVESPFSATSLAAVEGDIVITESPTKEFSDSSQSIEKSTVTRLSSVGMGNCTETEPGNSLAIIKYVEGTPMSKYVASRTHDSCCPLLPESVDVHGRIIDMDGPHSESLAIQHLPFVKTFPIWAELEALEIFSKVPQRPNFHLVQQHVPELREGLALGLMVSFANFAASINSLEVQDDKGLLEQKMMGLSLLEANGFDVTDMRSRLETLLHARNSRVELQDAMQKLEQQIAHKETEDRELGAQIRKLAMAVHHLELHAYLMRNVMRSAISQKMNNAMEISRLKTEANELERSDVSIGAPR